MIRMIINRPVYNDYLFQASDVVFTIRHPQGLIVKDTI
jgi:hypothetical protein